MLLLKGSKIDNPTSLVCRCPGIDYDSLPSNDQKKMRLELIEVLQRESCYRENWQECFFLWNSAQQRFHKSCVETLKKRTWLYVSEFFLYSSIWFRFDFWFFRDSLTALWNAHNWYGPSIIYSTQFIGAKKVNGSPFNLIISEKGGLLS